jgi:hypothetical protein
MELTLMSLSNYHIASPSTVILADDRNPYTSWLHHVQRAGRGGVDIVASVGTPVYARTAGVMRHIPDNGGAGNSCEFKHDANPGWRDVFSHLSRYVGESGDHFEAGEIVAYTGATGGVVQHLHWHLLDPQGVRRNPWAYFTPGASIHVVTELKEKIMANGIADIRMIEQNQSPEGPNYQSIMVFGTGLFHVFAPNERDIYNAFRNTLNHVQNEYGLDFRYKDNAVSIDKVAWDATERVFNPNYGK